MSAPYYAEGTYVCRVVEQSLDTTSNGNIQFTLSFTVLGPPDPEKPDHYLTAPKQLKRSWYCVLTEKTVDRALGDLHAIGFPKDKSFGRLDPKDAGFHNFRDQVVDMYCGRDADQQGNPRERWSVSRRNATVARQAVKAEAVAYLDGLVAKRKAGVK